MTFVLRAIDWINDVLGGIAMVFLVAMIGDMLYEVISRRVFGAPTMWAYDISFMLNGVGFMFAAGYTMYLCARGGLGIRPLPAWVTGAAQAALERGVGYYARG